MIRWLALAAAALPALLTSACGPPPIAARPALWQVSDGDTTIWLLGTIHALPPGVQWETPAVARAIDAADTLVTEIPAAETPAMAQAFADAAAAPGLPPILSRVAPAERSALAAGARSAGVSLASLDGMRSWAAAVTIAAGPMRAMRAAPRYGVERALAIRFAGRRHAALETQREQLGIFNALPEAAQRVLLARAVDDADAYPATLKDWAAGDVAGMAARFERDFAGSPVLQEMLVTRRNARWAGWIARRLRTPGRVLVAVGAGHLVGRDSVEAMLEARGVRVVRLQ